MAVFCQVLTHTPYSVLRACFIRSNVEKRQRALVVLSVLDAFFPVRSLSPDLVSHSQKAEERAFERKKKKGRVPDLRIGELVRRVGAWRWPFQTSCPTIRSGRTLDPDPCEPCSGWARPVNDFPTLQGKYGVFRMYGVHTYADILRTYLTNLNTFNTYTVPAGNRTLVGRRHLVVVVYYTRALSVGSEAVSEHAAGRACSEMRSAPAWKWHITARVFLV